MPPFKMPDGYVPKTTQQPQPSKLSVVARILKTPIVPVPIVKSTKPVAGVKYELQPVYLRVADPNNLNLDYPIKFDPVRTKQKIRVLEALYQAYLDRGALTPHQIGFRLQCNPGNLVQTCLGSLDPEYRRKSEEGGITSSGKDRQGYGTSLLTAGYVKAQSYGEEDEQEFLYELTEMGAKILLLIREKISNSSMLSDEEKRFLSAESFRL